MRVFDWVLHTFLAFTLLIIVTPLIALFFFHEPDPKFWGPAERRKQSDANDIRLYAFSRGTEQWYAPPDTVLKHIGFVPSEIELSSKLGLKDSDSYTKTPHLTITKRIVKTYAGQKINVVLSAKRPDKPGCTGKQFAIIYDTSGYGVSGWQRFTPTSEWQDFTVEMDVPKKSKGESDFVGISPDVTGSGCPLRIAFLAIEE